jgi:type IV pilus assembly protein PilE
MELIMKPKQRGVTLIELMIVVVVLAILASIATSSYRRQMVRANRTEATAALLRVRTAQEKYYLQHNEYAADLGDLGVPTTTQSGYYTLALDPDSNANEFEATATATGGQADDAACPAFKINEKGERTPASNDCWK